MKVIVAGSRTIRDKSEVERAILESGFKIAELVSGEARGVDQLGVRWAEEHGVPIRRFPADWNGEGKAAGPLRNKQMARYADALVLVWDGQSAGSKSMRREAEAASLRIFERVVSPDPGPFASFNLLADLRHAGFEVTMEPPDLLRVSPGSKLTPELSSAIKANKAALLAILDAESMPTPPCPEDPLTFPPQADGLARSLWRTHRQVQKDYGSSLLLSGYAGCLDWHELPDHQRTIWRAVAARLPTLLLENRCAEEEIRERAADPRVRGRPQGQD